MIWVYKRKNTNPTAGWVGWSEEMLRPTLLPRFRERKEVTSLRYKFRDISISSLVPLNVSIVGLDEASCACLWSRPFVAPLSIVRVVDYW